MSESPASETAASETPASETPALIPAGLDAVIAFVRHGESEWVARGLFQGQGDSPLTDLGRRQALLTARRIARRSRRPFLPLPVVAPHAIVHSPLARAAETAALIARAVSTGRGDDAVAAPVPLHPDPGLLEIGQGEWEGIPGSEVAERWGPLLESWRHDPLSAWAPGGESVAEVDVRARAALRGILADLATVAPAAGGARPQVLGYADLPADDPWSIVVGHDGVFKVVLLALLDLPLARFWTLPFALCGISVVEIRNGRPRLRLHNATDHLADLQTGESRKRDDTRRRSGAL
jgi:broad specificity phosphatase PhoE